MDTDEKPNIIEMALQSIEGQHPELAKELFIAEASDIILKTDLTTPELVSYVKLRHIDRYLDSLNISHLYHDILTDFLFANVSLDRKSRSEFVEVSTRKMSNIQIPAEFNKIEDSRK